MRWCFTLFVLVRLTITTAMIYVNDPLTTNEDRASFLNCTQPPHALPAWRLSRNDKTTYQCLKHPKSYDYWTMLNAYRSGGSKNFHWKYTTATDDPECLVDWTYYGKKGDYVVDTIQGRLTTKGDKKKKLWCPLAVAQTKKKHEPAGMEGKQWGFCKCTINGQDADQEDHD